MNLPSSNQFDRITVQVYKRQDGLKTGSVLSRKKAEVFLQAADDFDSTGGASLRPPRKPNDNDLVLKNVRPGRYWLNVSPYRGYVASVVAGSVDLLRQPLVVARVLPLTSSCAMRRTKRDNLILVANRPIILMNNQ